MAAIKGRANQIFRLGSNLKERRKTSMRSYQKPSVAILGAASLAIQGRNHKGNYMFVDIGGPELRPSTGLAYDLDELD